jgi:hypothetical protein
MYVGEAVEGDAEDGVNVGPVGRNVGDGEYGSISQIYPHAVSHIPSFHLPLLFPSEMAQSSFDPW